MLLIEVPTHSAVTACSLLIVELALDCCTVIAERVDFRHLEIWYLLLLIVCESNSSLIISFFIAKAQDIHRVSATIIEIGF